MARIQLKMWMAPRATLESAPPVGLAEGEIGIVTEDGTFVRRPDGNPTGTLVRIGITASGLVAGDLASGSVTTEKIPDGSIIAIKLADGSVVEAKVANGAITRAKLAATLQTAIPWRMEDNEFTGQNIFRIPEGSGANTVIAYGESGAENGGIGTSGLVGYGGGALGGDVTEGGIGVVGIGGEASSFPGAGVRGVGGNNDPNTTDSGKSAGVGVRGEGGNGNSVGPDGNGVEGISTGSDGVYGYGGTSGVNGRGKESAPGVLGSSEAGPGVKGKGTALGTVGVIGEAVNDVTSSNTTGDGVRGTAMNGSGVSGIASGTGEGVKGTSTSGIGVSGSGAISGVKGLGKVGAPGLHGSSEQGVGLELLAAADGKRPHLNVNPTSPHSAKPTAPQYGDVWFDTHHRLRVRDATRHGWNAIGRHLPVMHAGKSLLLSAANTGVYVPSGTAKAGQAADIDMVSIPGAFDDFSLLHVYADMVIPKGTYSSFDLILEFGFQWYKVVGNDYTPFAATRSFSFLNAEGDGIASDFIFPLQLTFRVPNDSEWSGAMPMNMRFFCTASLYDSLSLTPYTGTASVRFPAGICAFLTDHIPDSTPNDNVIIDWA